MPRRLKISPLQRDIMMTLEEAGAETVGTVIATLAPTIVSHSTRPIINNTVTSRNVIEVGFDDRDSVRATRQNANQVR
jgi:hypothetical protein